MTKTGMTTKTVESNTETSDVIPVWKATVLTIFPEIFPGYLGHSLAGKALSDRKWEIETVNIRDFAEDKHRSVDDSPFGGGAGMVMKPDVLDRAIQSSWKKDGPLIYMSPRGKPLEQKRIKELAKESNVTILCGRFEGVDQRLLDEWDVEEVSVGDYILSGGELAATILIDATVRLLPGVIGKKESHEEESFEHDLLEYPHYTRPRIWKGREVPEVLVSGHHKRVMAWQQTRAEEITQVRRPDLWRCYKKNVKTNEQKG